MGCIQSAPRANAQYAAGDVPGGARNSISFSPTQRAEKTDRAVPPPAPPTPFPSHVPAYSGEPLAEDFLAAEWQYSEPATKRGWLAGEMERADGQDVGRGELLNVQNAFQAGETAGGRQKAVEMCGEKTIVEEMNTAVPEPRVEQLMQAV